MSPAERRALLLRLIEQRGRLRERLCWVQGGEAKRVARDLHELRREINHQERRLGGHHALDTEAVRTDIVGLFTRLEAERMSDAQVTRVAEVVDAHDSGSGDP